MAVPLPATPGGFVIPGDDHIHWGDQEANVYDFMWSNDARVFLGDGGNDFTRDGNGSSRHMGHAGNDTMISTGGNDQMDGGAGDDYAGVYGNGNNFVDLDLDNDVINAKFATGHNTLVGGDGNDTVYAGSGRDTIYGGGGQDDLTGAGGNDLVYAGLGNDTVRGSAGNDRLFGEEGDDALNGGIGSDTLWGGDGNDTLDSSRDGWSDTLNGGNGNDKGHLGAGDYMNGGTGLDHAVVDGPLTNGTIVLRGVETLNLSRLNVGQGHVTKVGDDFYVTKGGQQLIIDADSSLDRVVLSPQSDWVPPPSTVSAASLDFVSHADFLFA